MGLPRWATEKSKVKVVETSEERILRKKIEDTLMREESDQDLMRGARSGITPDGSAEDLKLAELQYDGDVLNYHGYKFY